jgi:hypothetical protein
MHDSAPNVLLLALKPLSFHRSQLLEVALHQCRDGGVQRGRDGHRHERKERRQKPAPFVVFRSA